MFVHATLHSFKLIFELRTLKPELSQWVLGYQKPVIFTFKSTMHGHVCTPTLRLFNLVSWKLQNQKFLRLSGACHFHLSPFDEVMIRRILRWRNFFRINFSELFWRFFHLCSILDYDWPGNWICTLLVLAIFCC